jgi:hypothetical protein
MPNFDDVYPHNYKIIDYGVICKNNRKWGLVSLASDPNAHLICWTGHFLVIQK